MITDTTPPHDPLSNVIGAMRTDYQHATLTEAELLPDPIAQFAKWLNDAIQAKIPEPNAMSLATVNAAGFPSSRIVLIKDVDQRGFTWFTNYASRKGQDIAANPMGALLFHWVALERQVRIEGSIEKVAAEESDIYFDSRPLASRIGAISSLQSAPIPDRVALEQAFETAMNATGEHPARPEHWGGYRLIPTMIEFWQGRRSRLHDRIAYCKEPDGEWTTRRLQP